MAARKPSALAKSVTIEPLEGGTGTMVSAKPKGGVFAGQTLKVTVINLDGQWMIDKISSNAKVGPVAGPQLPVPGARAAARVS